MSVCADQLAETHSPSPGRSPVPSPGDVAALSADAKSHDHLHGPVDDDGNAPTDDAASPRPAPAMPVDALLPTDVLHHLRAAVEPEPRVTRMLVSELEARFDIERSYGVSLNRLASFLGRSRKKWQLASSQAEPCGKAVACTQPTTTESDPTPSGSAAAGLLKAHRQRQASVASILEATFGRLADSDPTLWDRRAYQLLVGLVYERLACDKDELPTVELVALAKVLNESRRANNHTPSKVDAKPESAGPTQTRELPKRFGDLIRQVYGATIDDPQAG